MLGGNRLSLNVSVIPLSSSGAAKGRKGLTLAEAEREQQESGGWVEKGRTAVVGGIDPHWGESFQLMVNEATVANAVLLVEVWRVPAAMSVRARGSAVKVASAGAKRLVGKQKVRLLGQVQIPAAWFVPSAGGGGEQGVGAGACQGQGQGQGQGQQGGGARGLTWMALRPAKSQKRADLAKGAISVRAALQTQ